MNLHHPGADRVEVVTRFGRAVDRLVYGFAHASRKRFVILEAQWICNVQLKCLLMHEQSVVEPAERLRERTGITHCSPGTKGCQVRVCLASLPLEERRRRALLVPLLGSLHERRAVHSFY